MVSCAVFAFCVLGIVASCAGIFFKPVCDALGVSRATISMYLTIQYLTMVVCLPIAGKLVPKHFKPMLIAGMAVYTLTFAAMSQFTSIYHWYFAGVLLGISGAIVIYLPIPSLINNWFKKRVGFALGFALAMSGVGGAIFNPLGAWIIQTYGWRTGLPLFSPAC
ncbi:MFS transporter [Desulfitobacterium chlororespirans]|uniref:Major Facilitator Superfamily protein n=1 Tax=Desulfitobacterium chlororespirans DSM 11544 TaxID=1121395 RepID=A0A1M7UZD4_9FIRM|nr:MFS transporter [Desulfitobacterium chlororespirans]SHN88277.1 Major Facilitator Superfamily protein [Desulfitobacterium chlororespirans DSM 11544]